MCGSVHGNCHRLRQRPAGDNSALNGRIVVMDMKTRRPLYLVHSPLGTNSWTVASAIEQAEIGDFPTLYAALSFVTPVRILHPIAALKATPSASEALKSLRGAGAGSEFGCSCHLWSAAVGRSHDTKAKCRILPGRQEKLLNRYAHRQDRCQCYIITGLRRN